MLTSLTIVALFVCRTAGDAQAAVRSTVYASGFSGPVAFVQDPTDRTVQFVVEQEGRIRVIRNGAVLPGAFLDIRGQVSTGGEQGLLGLAFAPNYATSGRFFINFTNAAGDTVVSRFKRSADPLMADASSRFDLHWGGPGGPAFIVHPNHYGNHNGGNVMFGPDGYLYIGMGDGGSGNDPQNHAQDPASLLGKILRIDVNVPDGNASGYQVPAGNPFAGGGGPVAALPEIWSFGVRNPWRWSFDDPALGGNGALVIGDVGQNSREEIDYEPANRGGRNYGWRNREGTLDNNGQVIGPVPPAYLPLTDPILDYNHATGVAVIGGFVYRGHALAPTYRGRYFYADLNGRVWSVALMINSMTGEATAMDLLEHTSELAGGASIGAITSFGVDADGELYILSASTGSVLKVLGPTVDMTSPTPGTMLSAPSATFTWTGDLAASQYWLDVGTTVGGQDIYFASQGLSMSRTVTGLPTNGVRVYARLWALTAGGWSYSDYTYSAALLIPAGITTPDPGTSLGGTTVTFRWTSGMGVSQIWLDIGTSPGGGQILAQSQGTSLSRAVSGLPSNGSTVYLRLWSLTSVGWGFTDYMYTAVLPIPAGITGPAPGATLTMSTATFSWTSGTAVSQIWLDIGTMLGGTQIYSASQGTALSRMVTGLPVDRSTIYVRLWSLTSNGWGFTDYSYTAAMPVPAGMLSPAPGSTVPAGSVTFSWTSGTGVTQIWLDVGTSAGGSQVYGATQGTALSRTVTGVPAGPVYVRIWSLTSSGWSFTDYMYMAS